MAKFRINPLGDRVVVEPREAEEMTAGGIVLPERAKEKPTRGNIVAVGPGKLLDSGQRAALSIKVGDDVFYSRYAGTEVEIGDKKYTVVRESDVLAVIE